MEYWEYWTPEEHERLIENMSAWMDGELPDIENTSEAGGPDDLELEVAEHQACCPSCRALFGELKELRAGFEVLPEPAPPEGFTQGVMDRIRAEEPKKVIPLFRRSQFKALAGLAACLALAAGLYGAARPQDGERYLMRTRGVDQTSQVEDEGGPRVNADLVDPEPADTPQIAAYAAPETAYGVTSDMQKAVPNPNEDGLEDDWSLVEVTTTLERMPEGAVELIPPETEVTPANDQRGSIYLDLPLEILDQIERLAQEQGIGVTAERTSAPGAEVLYNLEILQQNHG